MKFHFVRTGFADETIGTPYNNEIILKLAFQDSNVSAAKKAPEIFEGRAMPFESKAVTFQARSLKEITYAANNCFVGRGETFGLPHVYAERVVEGQEMDDVISKAGALFKLPIFYKSGFSGLAEIRQGLFKPVCQIDVILDKKTGARIFDQGIPVPNRA